MQKAINFKPERIGMAHNDRRVVEVVSGTHSPSSNKCGIRFCGIQCREAEAVGVQVGWIILKISGETVANHDDVTAKFRAAKSNNKDFEVIFEAVKV